MRDDVVALYVDPRGRKRGPGGRYEPERPFAQEGFQVCRLCRIEKPHADFHSRSSGQRRRECKPCRSALRKAQTTPEQRAKNRERTARWIAANREQALARRRADYAKNRPRELAGMRLRNTGWTAEAFEAAWAKQGGRCAICAVALVREWQRPNTVAADHCHVTGKPRELLCSACNRAIGLFHDDVERLKSAIAFLERHK